MARQGMTPATEHLAAQFRQPHFQCRRMLEVLTIGSDDLVTVAVLAEMKRIRPDCLRPSMPPTAMADVDQQPAVFRPLDERGVRMAHADIGNDALAGQHAGNAGIFVGARSAASAFGTSSPHVIQPAGCPECLGQRGRISGLISGQAQPLPILSMT